MDADGLPLVGPGIDYTKVEAINQKRTIAFINHFITHTSRFLNRFSCVCEEKLEGLHGRIQQLEISLSLLEAKLSSIPGLENVTAPTTATTTPSSGTAAAPATEATAAAPAAAAPPTDSSSSAPVPVAAPEPEAPKEEAPPANPVSKDPRYMKFFKMLQYGIPEHAVKNKMGMEGLDPNMLDTPDAPAPPDDAPKKDDDDDDTDEASDSDASFSD
ncbi:WASH complex subunit 3-like [Babylonia areolata]|uniref:WASH complex subunit 3-like n=1 Tax=Babylonia areolata TaxID=304850 RepID=UPI003FD0EFBA